MERETNLFDLSTGDNLPIWDIIRYNVYRKLMYTSHNESKFKFKRKRKLEEVFLFLGSFLKFIFFFPFERADYLFFVASRSVFNDKYFFDKSANDFIGHIKSQVIIETELIRSVYNSYYSMVNIFSNFFFTGPVKKEEYDKIAEILFTYFHKDILSFEEYSSILKAHRKHFTYYKFIIKICNPKYIIISTGNPKALCQAAQHMNVETYLIQHCGIELDEIDFSYPDFINPGSFIFFPDYVLTYGKYWCQNINVPAKKIIPIGNNSVFNNKMRMSDNSILFVSSIIHGEALSKLAIDLAEKLKNEKIVFKLHPNEYHNSSFYQRLFSKYTNIEVVLVEKDITE